MHTISRLAVRLSVCLVVTAPFGCQDQRADGPETRRDAMPSIDSLALIEALPSIDAAVLVDAAPSVDAATPVEAAAPVDVAVTADASVPVDAPRSPEQVPPQGRRLLDPWLAAGHYRSWKCEPVPVNPRPGSPHGRNRVCSNDLLSGHGAGPYPAGAAAVKEIYYGGRIGVFAVSIKIKDGTTGDAWYWYEQNDLEGVGAAGCTGCHARAARSAGNDFVYIQVK